MNYPDHFNSRLSRLMDDYKKYPNEKDSFSRGHLIGMITGELGVAIEQSLISEEEFEFYSNEIRKIMENKI